MIKKDTIEYRLVSLIGLAGEIKTDWLKAQIKTPYNTMQELSESIIKEAVHKSGEKVCDDMSVISIKLYEI